MKIVFNRKCKSVVAFDPIILPNFTVLTGINGAGKSHFLEAIENGSLLVEDIPPNQQNGDRFIRRFDSNSLVPQSYQLKRCLFFQSPSGMMQKQT